MDTNIYGLYKEYSKEETTTIEKLYPSDYFNSSYEPRPVVVESFNGSQSDDVQMGNCFGVVFFAPADQSQFYRAAKIYAAKKMSTYRKGSWGPLCPRPLNAGVSKYTLQDYEALHKLYIKEHSASLYMCNLPDFYYQYTDGTLIDGGASRLAICFDNNDKYKFDWVSQNKHFLDVASVCCQEKLLYFTNGFPKDLEISKYAIAKYCRLRPKSDEEIKEEFIENKKKAKFQRHAIKK
jgi:hypothetical protein